MSLLVRSFVRLMERHRAVVLALVVLLTAGSIAGLPQLKYNNNLRDLFRIRSTATQLVDTDGGSEAKPSTPALTENGPALTEPQHTADADNTLLLLLEGQQLLIGDGLQRLYDLKEELLNQEGVDDIVSVLEAKRQKRIGRLLLPLFLRPDASEEAQQRSVEWALEHPLLKGQMLARGGEATLVLIQLTPVERDLTANRELIDRIQSATDSVLAGSDTTASLIGSPVINTAVSDATMRDQLIFTVAGPLVALLLAVFLFRKPAVVTVVITGPMLAVLWTLGLLAWSGEERNLVNGVLTPLVITIALSQSVHFLFALRRMLDKVDSPREAWKPTLLEIGPMFLLTTATTMIGLGSLAVADLEVIQRFGIFSAIAILLAMLAIVTVTPLLSMTRLGDHLAAPSRDKARQQESWAWFYNNYRRLIELILNYRWTSVTVCLAATVLATLTAQHLAVDIRLSYGLPAESQVLAIMNHTDEVFGGTLPIQIELEWKPTEDSDGQEAWAAIHSVHDAMSTESIISPPLSLVTVLESLPGKSDDLQDRWDELRYLPAPILAEFFDPEAGRAIVVARCQDAGSQAIESLFTNLEAAVQTVEAENPHVRVRISETDIFSLREANTLVFDLIRSLLLAIVITMTLLVLTLKSPRLGAIALLPNLFPLVGTAAVMVWAGQPLSLTGAAVFSICFGIAVDDSIHALFNFQQATREGRTRDAAIRDVFAKLGRAMVTTTVIMVSGAAVVMLSDVFTLQLFGALFCISLGLALVGDLIIMPAVLAACAGHQVTARQTDQHPSSLPQATVPH